MVGLHVHGIMTRAITVFGGPPIPAGRMCLGIPYQDAGSLFFTSTRSHLLPDYEVWHSLGEPIMGPLIRSWVRLGRVSELFGNEIYMLKEATDDYKTRLCGVAWPFYDLYMFTAWEGGVNIFVHRHMSQPMHRWVHYHLDGTIKDIWAGGKLTLIGVTMRPEWSEPTRPARLALPANRRSRL